ncbi:MAG: acyl dehydratase [Desulfobacterales bacterium]|nr:acyl dehydratase [Desulfobacterales bacterium]
MDDGTTRQEAFRPQAVTGLKTGDRFTFTRTFTQDETQAFGALTRDYNPVHYDSRWSDGKGFDGLICHGLLVGGMICEFGGQVGWLATGMDFKFIRPVYFNQTITCDVVLTHVGENGRAEARGEFFNPQGTLVATVHMTGRLPLAEERALLGQMVAEGDPTNGCGRHGNT